MKNEYHIDVTPEEDALFRDLHQEKTKEKKTSFTKVFTTVFGVHLLIVFGVLFTTYSVKAFEIKKQINAAENRSVLGSSDPNGVLPKDFEPAEQNKLSESPKTISEQTNTPNNTPIVKQSKYTQTYQVKPGDTITKIAKKFKLSIKRLLEINEIKDPNKITPGQILKFM